MELFVICYGDQRVYKLTDDKSVHWLRCQLRVLCLALNSFPSYVVNIFEELNDMHVKTLKNGSFKLLCLFPD